MSVDTDILSTTDLREWVEEKDLHCEIYWYHSDRDDADRSSCPSPAVARIRIVCCTSRVKWTCQEHLDMLKAGVGRCSICGAGIASISWEVL